MSPHSRHRSTYVVSQVSIRIRNHFLLKW